MRFGFVSEELPPSPKSQLRDEIEPVTVEVAMDGFDGLVESREDPAVRSAQLGITVVELVIVIAISRALDAVLAVYNDAQYSTRLPLKPIIQAIQGIVIFAAGGGVGMAKGLKDEGKRP